MRALVIATTDASHANNGSSELPLLVDRPLAQHVVETLVERGVTQFDFVVGPGDEALERHLGDGLRWGCEFHYHRAADATRPYEPLQRVAATIEFGSCWLVHADRLPALSPALAADETDLPQMFYLGGSTTDAPTAADWTGWARLPAPWVEALPADCTPDEAADFLVALAQRHAEEVTVDACADARTPARLLAAQRDVLAGRFAELALYGREIEPGVRVARNVRVHRTARLVPPVYLGDNAWIGPGVELGPAAVVGRDAMVDRQTAVSDSLIQPRTYVGEELEVRDCLVDSQGVHNLRIGARVPIDDPLLVSAVY